MREGVHPGTQLFGDHELLYAIGPDAGEAAVYNALDGTLVGNRELPPARSRLDTVGRHVVTWSTLDGRQVLALNDPWSGKDLWKVDFEGTAQVVLVELEEAAVLEPSGKFTVVSLADGRVKFKGTTEPEPRAQQIYVIRSPDLYILVAHVPRPEVANPNWRAVTVQSIPVNGRVYGFDAATGARLWTQEILRQGIDLSQPASLPVLTFACCIMEKKNGQAYAFDNRFGLTCLDKRTGRLVFDERNLEEQFFSIDYSADPDQKQIELRMYRSVLRLTFTDQPVDEP
jgi:outer membrane protein assembly factor BamB